MTTRKSRVQGHALIEVLIAIVLSAIVVTIFFSLDTGMKRALTQRMSYSNGYTSLLLMRQRLAADIRRSISIGLQNDSLLMLTLENRDSALYQIKNREVFRNGIQSALAGFEARVLDIIYSDGYFPDDAGHRTDSLLELLFLGPDSDTVSLLLPLSPLADLKIHRR